MSPWRAGGGRLLGRSGGQSSSSSSSVIGQLPGPEVLEGPNGNIIAEKSAEFFSKLIDFDAVIIAGQAKSHCVAWTIDDLLSDIILKDRNLVRKIYLLEDCTSPVVIPGAIDYTDQADASFRRYSDEGMHVVRSTDPLETWPGIQF